MRCLCRAGERLGPDFRGFASGDNAGTLRLWSVTEGATPGSVGATELESVAASESYLLAVAESAQRKRMGRRQQEKGHPGLTLKLLVALVPRLRAAP